MRSTSELTEEAELKVTRASRVNELIALRGVNQREAATKIGTTQPKISQTRRYRPSNISLGRLLQALVAVELRIDIRIRPSEQRKFSGVRVAA
jgi:predicted XRE-type DNA-binding protein